MANSLFTALTFVLFIMCSSAWSARCGLDETGTAFTKKNGEKVYLLFGVHKQTLGSSLMDFLDRFDKDHDKASLSKSIDVYLEENSEGIKSHKAQLQKIGELVPGNQIQWIGDETLPQDFKAQDLEVLKRSAQSLKFRLQSVGLSNDKIESNLLLALSVGPYGFVRGEPW